MEEKKRCSDNSRWSYWKLKMCSSLWCCKISLCKAEEPLPGMFYFLLLILLPHKCSGTFLAQFSVVIIPNRVVPAGIYSLNLKTDFLIKTKHEVCIVLCIDTIINYILIV